MNSEHELSITHMIDAPRAAVWRALTGHLAEWWAPAPWTTELRAFEARPGGPFNTTMRGPDGESFASDGVVLDVVPLERFVFTDAFAPGWVPQAPFMVGVLDFADQGSGTLYTAIARHWDAEACARHKAMGFADGWTAAARQLAEVAKRIA